MGIKLSCCAPTPNKLNYCSIKLFVRMWCNKILIGCCMISSNNSKETVKVLYKQYTSCKYTTRSRLTMISRSARITSISARLTWAVVILSHSQVRGLVMNLSSSCKQKMRNSRNKETKHLSSRTSWQPYWPTSRSKSIAKKNDWPFWMSSAGSEATKSI